MGSFPSVQRSSVQFPEQSSKTDCLALAQACPYPLGVTWLKDFDALANSRGRVTRDQVYKMVEAHLDRGRRADSYIHSEIVTETRSALNRLAKSFRPTSTTKFAFPGAVRTVLSRNATHVKYRIIMQRCLPLRQAEDLQQQRVITVAVKDCQGSPIPGACVHLFANGLPGTLSDPTAGLMRCCAADGLAEYNLEPHWKAEFFKVSVTARGFAPGSKTLSVDASQGGVSVVNIILVQCAAEARLFRSNKGVTLQDE